MKALATLALAAQTALILTSTANASEWPPVIGFGGTGFGRPLPVEKFTVVCELEELTLKDIGGGKAIDRVDSKTVTIVADTGASMVFHAPKIQGVTFPQVTFAIGLGFQKYVNQLFAKDAQTGAEASAFCPHPSNDPSNAYCTLSLGAGLRSTHLRCKTQ